jgi:hypothetical protein
MKADLVADEKQCRGAECGGHLGPDGNQRFSHDGESRRICDAAACAEPNRNPSRVERGGDLWACAVNDDDLAPSVVEIDRELRADCRNAPAELQDDAGHVVYSAFSRT